MAQRPTGRLGPTSPAIPSRAAAVGPADAAVPTVADDGAAVRSTPDGPTAAGDDCPTVEPVHPASERQRTVDGAEVGEEAESGHEHQQVQPCRTGVAVGARPDVPDGSPSAASGPTSGSAPSG